MWTHKLLEKKGPKDHKRIGTLRGYKRGAAAAAFVSVVLGSMNAQALNFSFEGTLGSDDAFILFQITLTAPAEITILSLGHDGGSSASGKLVPSGGFDPIINLFAADGSFIDYNDDQSEERVDSLLTSTLETGIYFATLTRYPNDFTGSLQEGPDHAGLGNFCDTGDECLEEVVTRSYAVDVLNASDATIVPEPATVVLLSAGFAGLAWLRRRAAGHQNI